MASKMLQVIAWRRMLHLVWAARFKITAKDVCELRNSMGGVAADPDTEKEQVV